MVGRYIFGGIVVVVLLSIPHVIWPQMDVTMTGVETAQADGRLNVVQFELANGSYLDLKDPDIRCDMKGPSGTTIKSTSKVIYGDRAFYLGTLKTFSGRAQWCGWRPQSAHPRCADRSVWHILAGLRQKKLE